MKTPRDKEGYSEARSRQPPFLPPPPSPSSSQSHHKQLSHADTGLDAHGELAVLADRAMLVLQLYSSLSCAGKRTQWL